MTWPAAQLVRRGLALEYATLMWNVVGSVLLVVTAVQASSVALASFGLDSLIEIGASLVVIWQLTGASEERERRALALIGWAFFALAVYVLVQSVYSLSVQVRPERALLGTAWVGATVVVMLLLAGGKARVGRRLGNRLLQTEARVTLVDAYLAAAVLVGLIANLLLGWWWADPLAALVIVYYALKEGRAARAESARLVRPCGG